MATIAKGTTGQLMATGNYSDRSTQDLTTEVSWTSSAEGTAAVESTGGPNPGLVFGVAVGSASITATFGGISGFTTVSVIDLSLNNGASIKGTRLVLTDGESLEARSAFFAIPVGIQSFTNEFSFLLTTPGTSPLADGMTFTIYSGTSHNAVGGTGGSLGYGPKSSNIGGIANSVAVKFDLFNNVNEGQNSTGLYQNGESPFTPAIGLDHTVINLRSSHIFRTHMTYDGTNLTVSITDTVTNAVASKSMR
jgi:hypothetical protein